MARKYFGTDGIRGTANITPMTAEVALRVGMAAGRELLHGEPPHRVVIGKDTRLSGYMIESALMAGFLSVGMEVFLVGPLPTPAIAMLTRSMRADLGVMITASHNPFPDNGIKLFGRDGYKLSDEQEMAIEAHMDDAKFELADSPHIGRAKRLDDARGRYIEHVKSTFPKRFNLDGLKVVIDCANGAGYSVGPIVLYELGAEVISIGVQPNGTNINYNCGSTYPENLSRTVLETKADVGIALDGDGDRLIMVDEKGAVVDGDQLMAMAAAFWHKRGLLKGNGVVATQMSNLGFERYLNNIGLSLHRTQVGDRYVLEYMRRHGFNLGGEQSGHLIFSDYATSGDGLIAALQMLAIIKQEDRLVSEATHRFTPFPQKLHNIRYNGESPLNSPAVKQAVADEEAKMGAKGRILLRKSGTEPLLRVMVEAEDEAQVESSIKTLSDAINHAMATN
ncbi:MAG: phosphoglucosamine mutase [Alphaproteobacteria bacterium]|nr:phosphoglucosamine mutase [Alphaproteobacteria bacterium]